MKVRQVIRILEQDGWYFVRWGKGDHRIYQHRTKRGIVIVPGNRNWDLPRGTLESIWQLAGISRKDI